MKYGNWQDDGTGKLVPGISPRKAIHENTGADKPREKPRPKPTSKTAAKPKE